jgi:hypothetical protein
MKKTYAQTFEGWFYLDTNLPNARELIDRLFEADAGFGSTTEPGCRRIYWASDTADRIVREWHSETLVFPKVEPKQDTA